MPLDLATISTTNTTFFINDLIKLQPIMLAATTKSIHNQLTWMLNTNQIFIVQSTYEFLDNPGIP
jgi:hypothetical protein